jgi:hypothetical protein
MRDDGQLTVVYQRTSDDTADYNRDIVARRVGFDSTVFGEIGIARTFDDETNPHIAMNRDGSSFVVTFDTTDRVFDSSRSRVGVVEVTNDNVVTRRPGIAGALASAVSVGADGDYFVTYQRVGFGSVVDILGRRGRGSPF